MLPSLLVLVLKNNAKSYGKSIAVGSDAIA
jgi:hypothetical protein